MGLSKIIYNITTFNFFPRRKRIQYKLTENYVVVQKNFDKHKKLAKEKARNRARSNHIRETSVKSGTKIFININGARRISEKVTFKKEKRLKKYKVSSKVKYLKPIPKKEQGKYTKIKSFKVKKVIRKGFKVNVRVSRSNRIKSPVRKAKINMR